MGLVYRSRLNRCLDIVGQAENEFSKVPPKQASSGIDLLSFVVVKSSGSLKTFGANEISERIDPYEIEAP